MNYKKEVPVTQVLKSPDRILVLLPLDFYRLSSFIPAITLLRDKHKTAQIIGVVRRRNFLFFRESNLFDQIVSYESPPMLLSRQFFRLRKALRNTKARLSVDFNFKSDLLSWLGGATLRAGLQKSPFINCRVKLPKLLNQEESALLLVKTICIGP